MLGFGYNFLWFDIYNILGYISVCKASFALTLSALCRFPWVSHQRTTLPRFAQNNWIRYIVVAFLLYCSPETGTFFSNYLTFDLESTRVHYMWCRSANVHLEINFLTFQQELQCHFLFPLQTFVLFLLQTFIKLSKHKVIERARIINPNSPKMTFLAIDYPIATFWYIHILIYSHIFTCFTFPQSLSFGGHIPSPDGINWGIFLSVFSPM